MKSNLILLVVLFCGGSVYGQTPSPQKFRAVSFPREIGLISVAYQPNCPLRFENAKLLAGVEGGSLKEYRLRNIGAKAIRSIKIGDSTGNIWSWDVAKEHGPIKPGHLIPPWSKADWVEVLPLTTDLRKRLNLEGPMRAIVVLMVIRVEFMDGGRYDDETVFKALRTYVDDVQERLDRLATSQPKESLRVP